MKITLCTLLVFSFITVSTVFSEEVLLIPEGSQEINEYFIRSIYSDIQNISKIYVPKSVTNIDERSFDRCYILKEIEVAPDNVYYSSISGVLFNKLQTVLIHYPYAKIGSYYNVPNSVTHIADGAFSSTRDMMSEHYSVKDGLQSLKSIRLPEGLISIGNYSFSGLIDIERIDIPKSVIEIGDRAFGYCYNLTNIYIPPNVRKLGYDLFDNSVGRSSLVMIIVDDQNKFFKSINGVLFDKEVKILLQFPHGQVIESYTVPETVIEIRDFAFSSSRNLRTLILSPNIKSIGDYTLSGFGSGYTSSAQHLVTLVLSKNIDLTINILLDKVT